MPPVGFEPMISAGERPQTYALDRAASKTGTDTHYGYVIIINCLQRLPERTSSLHYAYIARLVHLGVERN
jgi:hypothetical protein